MKNLRRIAAGALAAGMLLASGCTPAQDTDYQTPDNTIEREMLYLAAYPEYPKAPTEEGRVTDAQWQSYQKEYDAYREQVDAMRGEWVDESFNGVVEGFAQKTVSSILTGAGNENRIYSPFNLFLALSMLTQTTTGSGQEQLLSLMGVDDAAYLAEQSKLLWSNFYLDNGISTRRTAASLWLNEGLNFKDDTLKALCEDYHASSAVVPLGEPETDRLIGSWLADMTGGVLENISVKTMPEDVMMLYATLYYADQWSDKFDESKTAPDTFTCADGTEVSIDFLNRETMGGFVSDEGFQAATLGLKSGSMTFVLPDEGVSIDQLLADEAFWERVQGNDENAHYGELVWKIPKFKVESTITLNKTLQALGVTDIFDAGSADFTPLTDSPAWIGQIRQGAGVELDERGVTAAAFTEILYAGAARPDGRCEMILDRPFLFLIHSGGQLMFAGVVNEV